MPDAFVVMGNGKVKKSSTIRALTGAYGRGPYDLATNNNIINIFVKIRSLQEDNKHLQEFINEIQQGGYNHVLLGLRINSIGAYANGISYLQDFINAGWNIMRNCYFKSKSKYICFATNNGRNKHNFYTKYSRCWEHTCKPNSFNSPEFLELAIILIIA